MRYIETSFFTCLLNKKPEQLFPFCKEIKKDIQEKKINTGISVITIIETVYVLKREYGWSNGKIFNKISELLDDLNPEVLDIKDGELIEKSFELYQKCNWANFNDILHYHIMKKNELSELYSIDGHFDSDIFTGVTRVFIQ